MVPTAARLVAFAIPFVLFAGCGSGGSGLSSYVPKSSELPDGYRAVPTAALDDYGLDDYMSSNPGPIDVEYFEDDVDPLPTRAHGGFYADEDATYVIVVFVLDWASEADLEEAVGRRSPCEVANSYAFKNGDIGTLVVVTNPQLEASGVAGDIMERTGGQRVCST